MKFLLKLILLLSLFIPVQSWGDAQVGNIYISVLETDPVVKAIVGVVKSNGTTISAATYPDITGLWTDCSGYLKSDGTCDTPAGDETDPVVKAIVGVVKSNGAAISAATYPDITGLWTACSGYLKSDGTCDTPAASMVYPDAGIAVSTGSAWNPPLQVDGSGDCSSGYVCTGGHSHSELVSSASPAFTGSASFTGTLGDNSIINGTFDTDASWTKGTGWTIDVGDSNNAIATATSGNLAETSSTVVQGKWYRLTHSSTVTSGNYQILAGGWTSDLFSTSQTATTRDFYTGYTGAVTFDGVSSFTGNIDDVLLEEITDYADFEKSVIKANKFQVRDAADTMLFKGGSLATTFFEGVDSQGIKVCGYDDKLSSCAHINVSSNGSAFIVPTGNLYLTPAAGNFSLYTSSTYDMSVGTDSDSTFQVGDLSFSWNHSPEFGNEGVAEFDAKAWFDGGASSSRMGTVGATSPAVSTCGTDPAIATGSSDFSGLVTIGSGATTACTVTFNAAFANEPSCTVTPQYNATSYISSKSNAVFTVTFSADGASQKFNYTCVGINE